MSKSRQHQGIIEEYRNKDQILVAIDCIIFGFNGTRLNALLIKRGFEPEKGKWSLMGGFVQNTESVDNAARRILHELTGIQDIFMEQLYCFGDVQRDPGGRVVSIAYYALIRQDVYEGLITNLYDAKWFDLKRLPALIFDHKKMIRTAKERLQQKVSTQPLGFELLPDKFTLPQLQNLFEAIYDESLDRRNFTRKIISLDILKKLNEKEKESSRKGAFLYTFNKEKYRLLERNGLKLIPK